MEYKDKIEGLVSDYFTTINTREIKTFSEKKDYENELRGLFLRSELEVEAHPTISIVSGSILTVDVTVSNGVNYLDECTIILGADWAPIEASWKPVN